MKRNYVAIFLLLVTCILTSATIPERSEFYPGLDEAAMRARLDESDIQPMEGIWYYPAENMTIGIERCPSTGHEEDYRLILLASDDLELLPGTLMGYMRATAVANKFTLTLYSERDHVTLLHPLECVATADAQCSTLTFEKPHWKVKVRVNFARFLPTIFHGVSVVPDVEKEKAPEGFKKIYPEGEGNKFNKIRYL